jgi:signal peptidase II
MTTTARGRRHLIGAAASVLFVDAASKVWASASLDEPVELVGSLSLQLAYNPGMAFGVGESLPSWVLLAVTGLICAGIAWGGWTGALQPPVAAGLIFGGAVGNLVDRMTGGSVVDMIHLTWWPTFNLADVAICTGAVLLVIGAFRAPVSNGDEPATPESATLDSE